VGSSPRPIDPTAARAVGPAPGGQPAPEKKVTSADVLEALHRATGLPIIADFYTHLYRVETVSARNRSLFDLLNQLADAMRLRWKKEAGGGADRRGAGPRGGAGYPRSGWTWLQFRSASYYHDRPKEVPNRLLTRWAAARQQHGSLTLDELLEIARLSDAQLDAADMAEGARECFGLTEWNLARDRFFRPHLRYLTMLTPAQQQEAQGQIGLPFTRLTLAQQQQFIALEWDHNPPHSLEELAEASLRIEHTQPGWFRWEPPAAEGVPSGSRPVGLSPVRERTRAAALQAAGRIAPRISPEQIVPTELAVTIAYITGTRRTGFTARVRRATPYGVSGWTTRLPAAPGGVESNSAP
jgi:hypothetical protein